METTDSRFGDSAARDMPKNEASAASISFADCECTLAERLRINISKFHAQYRQQLSSAILIFEIMSLASTYHIAF
jgi:hypothetical protein